MIPRFKVWCDIDKKWETQPCVLGQDGRLYHMNPKRDCSPLSPSKHQVYWATGFYSGGFFGDPSKREEVYEGHIILALMETASGLVSIKGLVTMNEWICVLEIFGGPSISIGDARLRLVSIIGHEKENPDVLNKLREEEERKAIG